MNQIKAVQDWIRKIVFCFVPFCLYGNTLVNIFLALGGCEDNTPWRRLLVYGGLLALFLLILLCVEYRKLRCEWVGPIVWFVVCGCNFLVLQEGNILLFVQKNISEIVLGFVFWGGFLLLATQFSAGNPLLEVYFLLGAIAAGSYIVYRVIAKPEKNYFFWIDYLTLSTFFIFYLLLSYLYFSEKNLSRSHKILVYVCMAFLTSGIIWTENKRDGITLLWILVVMLVREILKKRKKNLVFILVCAVSFGVTFGTLLFIDEDNRYVESMLEIATENEGMEATGNEILEVETAGTEPNEVVERKEPQLEQEKNLMEGLSLRSEIPSLTDFRIENIKAFMNWSQSVFEEVNHIRDLHEEYREMLYMDVLILYTEYSDYFQQDCWNGVISKEEYVKIKTDNEFIFYTNLGARMYLYANAVYEFLQSPVWGNGVYHYEKKYGDYTHCIYLEVLSDFGLCGLLVILAGLFVTAVYFFKSCKERHFDFLDAFVFYTICTLPEDALGGGFYSYLALAKYVLCPILCIYAFRKTKAGKTGDLVQQ